MNPSSFASHRPSRRVVPLVALLVFPVLNLAAFAQANDAPKVPTVRVEERILPDRFEFTGKITAVSHVVLKARVSGYVTKVAFREGQIVHEGDTLFQLDDRPFRARHAAAEAEVLRAQAAADLAASEATRGESLRQSGAISEEEAQLRRTAHLSAIAVVRAAEARLKEAALDLEFTTVRAPVTGRAGRALVIPGHLVQGGNAAGTELTEIVTVNPIRVLFEVDEPAYRRLHAATGAGLPVGIEVRFSDDAAVPARLDYLGNLVNPATGTAEVRAIMPNDGGGLVPGYFARVTISVGHAGGRLLVPEVAVGADQGGRYLLVVAEDGTVHYRRVKLGDRWGSERVVLEGLARGEIVVVNGLQRLRPGMKVAIAPADGAAVAAQ